MCITPVDVCLSQLELCEFKKPFNQALTSANRWVKLLQLLPGMYRMQPNLPGLSLKNDFCT